MSIPNLPYGYKSNKTGLRIVHEEKAAVIRLIYEKYINGMNRYEIVAYLNKNSIPCPRKTSLAWSYSTVNRILSDERYLGNDIFEAIISEELFSKATKRRQEELEKAKKVTTKGCKLGNIYPLSNFILCGNCGGIYTRHTQNKNKHDRIVAWTCSNATKHGVEKCGLYFNIPDVMIENVCIRAYNKVIKDISVLGTGSGSQLKKHKTNIMDLHILEKIEQLKLAVQSDDDTAEAIESEINTLISNRMSNIWANTTLDLTEYITENLKNFVQTNREPMTEFNEEKFKALFRNIAAIKPGELGFILKNGKQFSLYYTPLRGQEKLWEQKLKKLSR